MTQFNLDCYEITFQNNIFMNHDISQQYLQPSSFSFVTSVHYHSVILNFTVPEDRLEMSTTVELSPPKLNENEGEENKSEINLHIVPSSAFIILDSNKNVGSKENGYKNVKSETVAETHSSTMGSKNPSEPKIFRLLKNVAVDGDKTRLAHESSPPSAKRVQRHAIPVNVSSVFPEELVDQVNVLEGNAHSLRKNAGNKIFISFTTV